MQHFRSGLTRLRSLIEQKLPDGDDIHGYPGVTKNSLLVAIDSAYSLSQDIHEDAQPRFEIISLKRAGSDLYKNLKDYLESSADEKDKRVGFNEFLNNLSALIEKTKITYFIVTKNGIRDDEELTRIRSRVADLTMLGDELEEEKDVVHTEIESISTTIQELNANYENSARFAEEIKQWHGTTKKRFEEIAATHGAIAGWDKDVAERQEEFEALSKEISEINATAVENRDKLLAFSAEGKKSAEDLESTASEHRKLLDEIRQTLEGANRVGMAASFLKRKRELGSQQATWQGVFVVSTLLIVLAVWKFVLPTISAEEPQWSRLLAELGLVSPLVWLGWFAAKQYGYISKIREDYAFKAAAAMAYEGHKKAARDVNEELEQILLEFSLFNLSQNPIRLYGTGDIHGTPIHEAVDQMLRKFPSLRKVAVDAPGLGRFEVSGESASSDGRK